VNAGNLKRKEKAEAKFQNALNVAEAGGDRDAVVAAYGSKHATTVQRVFREHDRLDAWNKVLGRDETGRTARERAEFERRIARTGIPTERAAAVVEDAEFLARHGVGRAETARRASGTSWDALLNTLQRAGRTDIADRLLWNDATRDNNSSVPLEFLLRRPELKGAP
jgi:hypothetical protein